jgi:hypothetical protein
MPIARCSPSLPGTPFPYEQLEAICNFAAKFRGMVHREDYWPWSGSVKRNDLADTCAVVPATRPEVICASLATEQYRGCKEDTKMWLFAPSNVRRRPMQTTDSDWRPRRDLNQCYRRERNNINALLRTRTIGTHRSNISEPLKCSPSVRGSDSQTGAHQQ